MKNRKLKTNEIESDEFEINDDGEIVEKYSIIINTKKQNQFIDDWYINHTAINSGSWEIKHYNIT